MEKKKVFAFNLGKGSIGACVRVGDDIKYLDSLIIPVDMGTLADRRERRRSYWKRLAHQAREANFKRVWEGAGLAIPDTSVLTKEFTDDGDFIHTSCLLRLLLFEGQSLEPFQIYKALSNIIQRRGYDSNIPWKASHDDADDEESNDMVNDYIKLIDESIKNKKYRYPCYLSALRMGLWDEKRGIISTRVSRHALNSNKHVIPRSLIVAECRELYLNAQKQLPQLKIDVDEFLYGKSKKAYQSYSSWEGVLAQKYPRFNNRIISKCGLFPKRNVCSIKPYINEPSVQFSILSQLKNLRFLDEKGNKRALNKTQFNEVYQFVMMNMHDKHGELKRKKALKSDLNKILKKDNIKIHKDEKITGIIIKPSGRSRFCRPALRLLVDILGACKNASEIDPSDYVTAKNNDYKTGITIEEVEALLKRVGRTWELFHISDDRHEQLKESKRNPQRAIKKLLNGITNPLVKHRVGLFDTELVRLQKEHGTPDVVNIELVRDNKDNSLESTEKIKGALALNRKNKKDKDESIDALEGVGIEPSPQNILKYRLLKELNFMDLITGAPISVDDLDRYEIDYIVPRSANISSDGQFNKTLLSQSLNLEKDNRTPHEWLKNDKRWGQYINRVASLKLGNKKTSLLLSESARDLIESYNPLADSAYISKLAHNVVCIRFGWGMSVLGEKKHVYLSNGTITHKIRQKYKLNQLLYQNPDTDMPPKNWKNNKGHALDALCISYIHEYSYLKTWKPRLDHEEVRPLLAGVVPRQYTRDKSELKLKETIYGKRGMGENHVIFTVKKSIIDLLSPIKEGKPRGRDKIQENINKIIDGPVRDDLTELLENCEDATEGWIKLISNYKHPGQNTRIDSIRIIASKPQEWDESMGADFIGRYAEIGKEKEGQYKKTKQHKGQIIYFDKKGAARVATVYAHMPTDRVISRLDKAGHDLYLDGHVFYSSMWVSMPDGFNRIKSDESLYPAGQYQIKSIRSDGSVMIADSDGVLIATNIAQLTKSNMCIKTNT